MSKLKVGQKLYHFAYGPLTIVSIEDGDSIWKYVDTIDDYPTGYRFEDCSKTHVQTWILESVGHWLFEKPEDVGKEDDDWKWQRRVGASEHTTNRMYPVYAARNKKNWHKWYFDNGYADIRELYSSDIGVPETPNKKTGGITEATLTNKTGGITSAIDNNIQNNRIGGITDSTDAVTRKPENVPERKTGGITEDVEAE